MEALRPYAIVHNDGECRNVALFGHKSSGKTRLALFWLSALAHNRVVAYCSASDLERYHRAGTQAFTTFDEQRFRSFLDSQRQAFEVAKNDKNNNTSVMRDRMVAVVHDEIDSNANATKSQALREAIVANRHAGMTNLLVCQDLKCLAPDLRANCDVLVFVGALPRTSFHRLWSEYGYGTSFAEFVCMYDAATKNFGAFVVDRSIRHDAGDQDSSPFFVLRCDDDVCVGRGALQVTLASVVVVVVVIIIIIVV